VEGWTRDQAFLEGPEKKPLKTSEGPQEKPLKTMLKFRGLDMGPLGRLHGADLISPDSERMAWMFGVERKGYLDIEELFVRPEYRNKGNARTLVKYFHSELAKRLGKEIRYWVPHSDTDSANLETFKGIIAPFSLTLKPSRMAWASYEASKGSEAESPTEPVTAIQVKHPASPFCPAKLLHHI